MKGRRRRSNNNNNNNNNSHSQNHNHHTDNDDSDESNDNVKLFQTPIKKPKNLILKGLSIDSEFLQGGQDLTKERRRRSNVHSHRYSSENESKGIKKKNKGFDSDNYVGSNNDDDNDNNNNDDNDDDDIHTKYSVRKSRMTQQDRAITKLGIDGDFLKGEVGSKRRRSGVQTSQDEITNNLATKKRQKFEKKMALKKNKFKKNFKKKAAATLKTELAKNDEETFFCPFP
eukprot:Pgem_evm1s9273